MPDSQNPRRKPKRSPPKAATLKIAAADREQKPEASGGGRVARETAKERCEHPAIVPDQWIVRSLRQVAEFFSVREDTVKKDWRRGGMPGAPKRWDLAAIARWKASRNRDPEPDGSEPRRRKQTAEARLSEIELARREREERHVAGELLERVAVEQWAARALIETRETLCQLPDLICALVPVDLQPAVLAETERVVRDTLQTLRKRLDHVPA